MTHKPSIVAVFVICCIGGFILGKTRHQAIPSPPQVSKPPIGPMAEGRHANRPQGRSPAEKPETFGTSFNFADTSRATTSAEEAIMQSILNEPDTLARAEAWLDYVSGLSEEEIRQSIAYLSKLKTPVYDQFEGLILYGALAKHGAADAFLSSIESNSYMSSEGLEVLMSCWASEDPAAAARWAEEYQLGDAPNPWMTAVTTAIGSTDLAGATEQIKAMPHSAARTGAVRSISMHALEQGPAEARNWAMSFEEQEMRTAALHSIACDIAIRNPADAADWLLSVPNEDIARTLKVVMRKMAEKDPQTVIAYLDTIQDKKLKTAGFEGAIDWLPIYDREIALELMKSNLDLVTESSAFDFIRHMGYMDPAVTTQIFKHIKDPEKLARTQFIFYSRWSSEDPEAAAAWAESVGFTVDP